MGLLSNDAYLAFVQHPAIAPHLQRFYLGSGEQSADFWLILDRHEPRRLSLVPVGVAKPLVEEQWGPPTHQDGPLVVALEDLPRALQALQQRNATTTGSTQTVLQAMQAEQQQCDELVAWLDAYGRKQQKHTD